MACSVSVAVIVISEMGNGGGAGVSAVLQMPILAGPGGSFQATSIYMCRSKYTIISAMQGTCGESLSGVAEATLQWPIYLT